MTSSAEAALPTIAPMFPIWQAARTSLKGYERLYGCKSCFETTWVDKP